MKNLELFALIFRQTHVARFLGGFAVFFLVACTAMWLLDPSIDTFWNGLWFGFMVITTIGFGDFTVTSWITRLIAACLGIYGILLSGFVCGIGATYLFEKIRIGREESVSEMIWQLEHLDRLDDTQIQKLKKKISSHADSQSGKNAGSNSRAV